MRSGTQESGEQQQVSAGSTDDPNPAVNELFWIVKCSDADYTSLKTQKTQTTRLSSYLVSKHPVATKQTVPCGCVCSLTKKAFKPRETLVDVVRDSKEEGDEG